MHSSKEQAITRRVVMLTILQAAVFWIFFDAAKHNPYLSSANIFLEDPYDAVGSFGIQLACFSALLALVRCWQLKEEKTSLYRIGRVLRASLTGLLAVAVSLAADGIALLRYVQDWYGLPAGILLAALVSILFASSAGAIVYILRLARQAGLPGGSAGWTSSILPCLAAAVTLVSYPPAWRESIPGAVFTALAGIFCLFWPVSSLAKKLLASHAEPEEDILDDLVFMLTGFSKRSGAAELLSRRLNALVEFFRRSRIGQFFDPRKHARRTSLLTGLALGAALLAAELLSEGMPALGKLWLVIVVFVGLETAGIITGFQMLNGYLSILRVKNADQLVVR